MPIIQPLLSKKKNDSTDLPEIRPHIISNGIFLTWPSCVAVPAAENGSNDEESVLLDAAELLSLSDKALSTSEVLSDGIQARKAGTIQMGVDLSTTSTPHSDFMTTGAAQLGD